MVTQSSAYTSVGTNGLADHLETSADSDSISYTYFPFAYNDVLNACLDSDNDGVGDLVDIDDDNDGILDINEIASCMPPNENLIIPAGTNGLNSSFARTSTGTYADWEVIGGQIDLVAVGAFGWLTQGGIMIDGGASDGKVKTDITTVPGVSYDFGFYHARHTGGGIPQTGRVEILNGSTIIESLDINSQTVVTDSEWESEIISFVATSTTTTITMEQLSNNSGFGPVFSGMGFDEVCDPDVDTDGDGTPDRLDLDSDGDGCSDLAESGAGAVTDSLVTQSGTYTSVGTNGFADDLETSADSDSINYIYFSYAYNSNANACLDSDNDGVGDLVDIDDDNDGILAVSYTHLTLPTICSV